MDGPLLETPRLVLRPPRPEDLPGWEAMLSEPFASRFIGGVQPPFNAWRSVMLMAGNWALHGYGLFSVIEKASGRWIGRIGPWHPPGWPGPEVAWAVLGDVQGTGMAFEAAEAAMGWTFGTLGWPEVVHCIDPANTRSQALARRLGSAPRGTCRPPRPYDREELELWGQDRAAWLARPR
jgi:RimJ/RimL family protein N-acetyltransferase